MLLCSFTDDVNLRNISSVLLYYAACWINFLASAFWLERSLKREQGVKRDRKHVEDDVKRKDHNIELERKGCAPLLISRLSHRSSLLTLKNAAMLRSLARVACATCRPVHCSLLTSSFTTSTGP